MNRSRAAYNTSGEFEGSQFAPETYDAVWAVALGLEKVQKKHNYDFDKFNRTNGTFTQLLKSEIGQLNFSGISVSKPVHCLPPIQYDSVLNFSLVYEIIVLISGF